MKIRHLFICLLASSVLAACTSSDSSSGSKSKSSMTVMQGDEVVFNEFVLDLIQNQTSDTSDAVAINALNFEFEDEGLEDETAFDDLF